MHLQPESLYFDFMTAKVTLTAVKGSLSGQQFVFTERTSCVIGRGTECYPRIPDDEAHQRISRHHCLLDINPPDIRIRDFGSLNGTYVNQRKIGNRDESAGEAIATGTGKEADLRDGDQIDLGDTRFAVTVEMSKVCRRCGAEAADGVLCEQCLAVPESLGAGLVTGDACVSCGRSIGSNASAGGGSTPLCIECRQDPRRIIRQLLDLAKTEKKDLVSIRGYAIERELGRGGMGAVYLARHEETGQRVALKVMLPKVAIYPKAQEMFLREVENTKALNHDNVVRLHDSGCSESTFFFTLEYCDGGSVDKLMEAQGGKLPLATAAPIMIQVLEGLSYAHQAPIPHVRLQDGSSGSGVGLVHRDLSPHNIFLMSHQSSLVAKVGDYGLSKAFDTAGLSGQTMTGAYAGKPLFMPRQQVLNHKFAKPEVDVWAAAASFYAMLTGQPPRQFAVGKDVWQTVLQTDAVPIRARCSSVPDRVAEVIDAALVDNPEIPFKSAQEFKQALESVL